MAPPKMGGSHHSRFQCMGWCVQDIVHFEQQKLNELSGFQRGTDCIFSAVFTGNNMDGWG